MLTSISKFLRFRLPVLNYSIQFIGRRCKYLTALGGKVFWFSVAIIAATQLSACNMTIRAGYKPNVLTLEKTLKPGVSTEQEVLKELGAPTGKGREMLPFMDASQDIWSYYYEEGDLSDDRRLFLFVLFSNGRYDGYMWFSSLH